MLRQWTISFYQIAPKGNILSLLWFSCCFITDGTERVGLAIAELQKGLQFLSDVTGEMDRNKIFVAFVKMMTTPLVLYIALAREYINITKETSQVKVVIIYYDIAFLNDVNYT